MTKKEMLQGLSKETGLTQKDCEAVYNSFLGLVAQELNVEAECQTVIPGLGTIKVKVKEAHESRNPRTKELVQVPRKREARMSLSESIKKQLDQNI